MFEFKKILFYLTTGRNSLIFGMEQSWYMEIKDVCSNKVLVTQPQNKNIVYNLST